MLQVQRNVQTGGLGSQIHILFLLYREIKDKLGLEDEELEPRGESVGASERVY